MERRASTPVLVSAPEAITPEVNQWTYPYDEQFLADVYDTYLTDSPLTDRDKKFGLVGLEPSTPDEKALFVPILSDELRKYPPFMITHLQLRPMHLASKLTFVENEGEKPRSIAGLATAAGDIYLVTDPQSTDYFARVLHHEIFHAWDFYHMAYKSEHRLPNPFRRKRSETPLDVRIYRSWKREIYPTDDPYLYQEYHQQVPNTDHDDVIVEFARKYGIKNPMEDRATTFEEMMTNSSDFKERLASDPILRRKVKAIKKDIRKWSCNHMARRYFKDLEKGRLGRRYFV